MEEPKIQTNIKTYSELIKFSTFKERFNYLKLDGLIGKTTFGGSRHLNQNFYRSEEWKQIRNRVIARDMGCDLGLSGYELHSGIFIHHMNPITARDIIEHSDLLMNPEYLITVSFNTHNAIHYSDQELLVSEPAIRKPGDTCPWKQGE